MHVVAERKETKREAIKYRIFTGLLSLLVVTGGGAALAQTAPAASTKGKTEEITVTAQKRSENVRKVPLSVTVLSGAKIKADHITNFADLTRAVPNLSFSSQAGAGLSTLELRGIASQAGTATVALYLDDVSLTTRNIYTQGTAEPRFLDISRVEVLRGPQGTLYGASALGGTLKYIANQPNPAGFTASVFSEVAGTYHGAPSWDEQGVMNMPLVQDKVTLRVSGETGGDGGYIDNIDGATNKLIKSNINSTGYNDARAAVLITPNDWLSITPQVFYQGTDSRDSDAQYLALPNNFETPKTVAEPGNDKMFVPSLTVKADLGFADLISASSFYTRSFERTLDSTIYNNLSLYVCTPANTVLTCNDTPNPALAGKLNQLYYNLFNLPSYTYYNNQVRQYQQEFRLVSKPYDPQGGGLPFTWLGGVYVSDEYSKATDIETVKGANAAFADLGLNPSDPSQIQGGAPGFIQNDHVFNGLQSYSTTQYAVFGEATYYPMPNMRLTAGGRYLIARDVGITSEDEFYSYGLTGRTSSINDVDAFTPKFAWGWDILPDNTIYANASKGLRLGSTNRPLAYLPDEANSPGTPSYDLAQLGIEHSPIKYGPDQLWNFEIGDKGRFFDGRLVASADFFYILWNDIQTYVPLTTSGLDFETNAGNATSYGGEFELRGHITDSLTAGLSGAYTHATLDKGVYVGNTILSGTFPGERVPGVPEYNIDLDGRQDFNITDTTGGFITMDVPWVGESHGEVIEGNADYKRPSYVTLDAAVGVDYGKWEFTIFGKNLSNNNKIIQKPDIQGSGVDIPGQAPIYGFNYLGNTLPNTQGFTLRPLTVGFNASYKF